MTHEIRKGDEANPSAQQLKDQTVSDPSPQSGEGLTTKDVGDRETGPQADRAPDDDHPVNADKKSDRAKDSDK